MRRAFLRAVDSSIRGREGFSTAAVVSAPSINIADVSEPNLTSRESDSFAYCHVGPPSRPAVRGLLVDAAGTLISPSERTSAVYRRYGEPFGVDISEGEILARFRKAYSNPWTGSIRYVGDGRPFWRQVVADSTGCSSQEMFEQVYEYYQRPEAWSVAPGAVSALKRLRASGVRLAVVSNFDTRLVPLMDGLGLTPLFDEIVVSAEVGAEKPSPVIFEAAISRLGMDPHEVVHVGDDRRNDIWGARDVGITAWLWGSDVESFDEVADKLLRGDMVI